MSNDEIMPVNHSASSAFGAKAVGTAGGAIKTGLAAAASWIGVFTLIGVAVGLTIASGGFAALFGSTAAGGTGLLGFLTSGTTWGVLLGGAAGAAIGTGTSWLPGGLGAVFGGLKGGSKASARVENERFAASQVQAQIDIARAQAMAQSPVTNVYAPSAENKYNFPAQGSSMNQASTQLFAANDNAYADEASRAAALGTVAGQRQLQQG